MEENKRKAIILTFIGALTLLFVVVGGTFAYFQIVNTDEGSTSTDFETQTDTLNKYGIPKLTKNSDLYINLSASDMSYGNGGNSYWATLKADTQEKNYEEEKQNHIISTASIEKQGEDAIEDAYLSCTSELTILVSGGMKDVLETGDGTLYLGISASGSNKGSIEPSSFDLADLVSKQESGKNKVTVNYTIVGYTSVGVTADVEIVNKEGTPQNALAGTNITITITNNNLSCSVSNKPTTIDILREKDTGNYLSTSLVGDMYRYQGLGTDNINNYICLGDNCCTTESCPASDSDDMYRIIGITQSSEIKVIKKTALTDGLGWRSSSSSDFKWPESLIYQKLNGKSVGSTKPNFDDINSYYYSLDANLKSKIVNNHGWLYGDAYGSNGFGYNGDTIYGIESGSSEATYYQKGDSMGSRTGKGEWSDIIEAPIGLMYISDYYYAYKKSEEDARNPGSKENAINSWIHLSHNEETHSSGSWGYEWTMSRYGFYPSFSYYNAWYVHDDGSVNFTNMHFGYALRPTFYLSSDAELTGEGSLTNPFTVKGVSS